MSSSSCSTTQWPAIAIGRLIGASSRRISARACLHQYSRTRRAWARACATAAASARLYTRIVVPSTGVSRTIRSKLRSGLNSTRQYSPLRPVSTQTSSGSIANTETKPIPNRPILV